MPRVFVPVGMGLLPGAHVSVAGLCQQPNHVWFFLALAAAKVFLHWSKPPGLFLSASVTASLTTGARRARSSGLCCSHTPRGSFPSAYFVRGFFPPASRPPASCWMRQLRNRVLCETPVLPTLLVARKLFRSRGCLVGTRASLTHVFMGFFRCALP